MKTDSEKKQERLQIVFPIFGKQYGIRKKQKTLQKDSVLAKSKWDDNFLREPF